MFSLDNPWKYGILKPLIRRDILEQMGLRYNEKLRFGEDLLLTAEVLFRGARGVLTREGYYLYTTPVGHLSRERSTGTRSTTSLESLMWITDFLAERYQAEFNPGIRRGLGRCRRRIRQRLVAREITQLRQSRRLPALATYLLSHPHGALRYLLTSRSWSRVFGLRMAS